MAWSKESRHKRGYGSAWDKTRKRILERDGGLCQCDKCKGGKLRISIATEVDHVVNKAKAKQLKWSDERIEADDNLQAINSDCHKRKTQEEQGKTYKPKVKIGADGWPVPE